MENNDIVGMWASIFADQSIKYNVFIYGKTDEGFYIVQAINALTGEPNIAKLINISQMLDWTFYPSKEIAEWALEEIRRNEGAGPSLNI